MENQHSKAIVAGAGVAGLAAAAAVAPHFGEVLILERDRLTDMPGERAGVPHGNQPHVLLLGAQYALRKLVSDFEGELAAAGAVPCNLGLDSHTNMPGVGVLPQRDFGLVFLSASRPLVEGVLRRAVQQLPNVTIVPGCRVEALLASDDGRRVCGVRHAGVDGASNELKADLVIDASGRHGKLTGALLDAIGYARPPETEVGIEVTYTTAVFGIPEGAALDFKFALYVPEPPHDPRGALLLPIEGRRWMVTLVGRFGQLAPTDREGFLASAKDQRSTTIYEAICDAELLETPSHFVTPGSRWRHYDRLETFPDGLLPIGDSICQFNPVYGQGMSVAAQEAVRLRELLDAGADGEPGGLARQFFAGVPAIVGPAWAASIPDLAFPQTRGERPADLAERLLFSAALFQLAVREPEAHRMMAEVNSLIRSPADLQTPEMMQRIAPIMQAIAARAVA